MRPKWTVRLTQNSDHTALISVYIYAYVYVYAYVYAYVYVYAWVGMYRLTVDCGC